MKKKLTIVFITFFIGLITYLLIPVSSTIKHFPKEEPIKLISSPENNNKRCQENTIYITESSRKMHEDEGYEFIVNDYCANLQKDLITAINEQNLDKIRELFAKGANPNTTDFSTYQSISPLNLASYKDNANLIKLLLDNEANPNNEYCCCLSCNSPLSNAIKNNNSETVQLLLERGADVKYRLKYNDTWRNSVIDIALANNNLEIADNLINHCDSVICRAEFRTKKIWYYFENMLISK